MAKESFGATPIYTNTVSDLNSGVRRIVHQGGAWSGKTVGILGGLASLCCEDEMGDVTTVTSQSMPHLKGGALRDFETFVAPYFRSGIKRYHKTDHLYTFRSGALLEFKVFEDEMKARGNKRKRLFINEANSFPYMIYYQLDSRSEQTIIDYNPSIRFWAHDNIIGFAGNKTYISDHRHNPYLTESKHAEIERQKDKELWKVYARGLTGNVTGLIFPNWQMIDDEDFPKDEDFIYSIDFGHSVDPTVIIKSVRIGNNIYVKELCYETALSERSIFNLLKADGFDMEESVLYCEHDPDIIRSLRNIGVCNAVWARKGSGSVNAGIKLLNEFNVKYSSSSRNLHRERSLYIWMKDKDTGKLLNVPVDNNNHAMDAIRYGIYSKYLKQAA